MREELFGPKVENVVVAVAQQFNEENHPEYYVYLMNLRDDIMEGIIITSTGYGENANTGEKIKTSTLIVLNYYYQMKQPKLNPLWKRFLVFRMNIGLAFG
jgi:hypothetical protein